MFDIGFWELGLIMVIALIVVGPERLPRLARTAGLWIGKIRSSVRNIRDEIEREVAAEELKKQLAKQSGSEDLYEIVEETRSIGQELRQDAAGGPDAGHASKQRPEDQRPEEPHSDPQRTGDEHRQ